MYSQSNLEELFQIIGNYPNQQFGSTAHFDFVKTTGSVWPNQLFNLRAQDIEHLNLVLNDIERHNKLGRLPNLYMSNPLGEPEHFIQQLKARQYGNSTWTAMSHDLRAIDNKNETTELSIKTIQTVDKLSAWLHIVETELMAEAQLNFQIFEELLQREDCYFFAAYDDEVPVATALLFKGSNSAGIYLVATSKAARQKGFGTLITRHCLQKAHELNCQQVDIQATEAGLPIYQKLGFKTYGKIHVFRIEKSGKN